jgi:hypothetical protein
LDGSPTNRPFILDQKPWRFAPGFFPVFPATGACAGDGPLAGRAFAFGLGVLLVGVPASTCPVNSHSGSTCDSRINRIDRGSGSGGGCGDSAENVSGGIITFHVGASSALVVESAFLGGAMGRLSLALAGTLNSTAGCPPLAGGFAGGFTVLADVGVMVASGAVRYARGAFTAGDVAAELTVPSGAPGDGG